MRKIISILSLFFVVSCQTGTEALNVDDVRKSELIAAECAIYFTVEKRLASEGRIANGNMSEGCQADAAERAADLSPVQPPRELESRYATILFQRMIARGMPTDVAASVSKSKAFHNLVMKNDAING